MQGAPPSTNILGSLSFKCNWVQNENKLVITQVHCAFVPALPENELRVNVKMTVNFEAALASAKGLLNNSDGLELCSESLKKENLEHLCLSFTISQKTFFLKRIKAESFGKLNDFDLNGSVVNKLDLRIPQDHSKGVNLAVVEQVAGTTIETTITGLEIATNVSENLQKVFMGVQFGSVVVDTTTFFLQTTLTYLQNEKDVPELIQSILTFLRLGIEYQEKRKSQGKDINEDVVIKDFWMEFNNALNQFNEKIQAYQRQNEFFKFLFSLIHQKEISEFIEYLNQSITRLHLAISIGIDLTLTQTKNDLLNEMSNNSISQEKILMELKKNQEDLKNQMYSILQAKNKILRTWTIEEPSTWFSGRENELNELSQSCLNIGPQEKTKIIVIYGMKGVGKTQLVKKFCDDNRNQFSFGWFLNAESEHKIQGCLVNTLHFSEDQIRNNQILSATASFLEKPENAGWLLILDNLQDYSLIKHLKPDHGGVILITSLIQPPKDKNMKRIQLKLLERDVSIKLLTTLSDDNDIPSAKQIAAELGDLPLALVQAGLFVQQTRITLSLSKYLTYLRKEKTILVKSKPDDYPFSVATTLKITIDEITKEDDLYFELLYLLSFLDADGIPMWLISNWMKIEKKIEGIELETTLGSAIEKLQTFFIIQISREKEQVSLHRLIQAAIRDFGQSKQGLEKKYFQVLLQIFDDERSKLSKKAIELSQRQNLRELLLNFDAFSNHIMDNESLYNHFEQLALVISELGLANSFPITCSHFLANCLKVRERTPSTPNSLNLVRVLNNIGLAKYLLGQIEKAREYYERSLKLQEEYKDQKEIIPTLNLLASVCRRSGDIERAKELCENALRIGEKSTHKNDNEFATTLATLGLTFSDLGEIQKAKELYMRALEIQTKIYGPSSHYLSKTLNNLGYVNLYLEEYDKALELFQKALLIQEKQYGKDHFEVAWIMDSIGEAYISLGKFQEAIEILTKCIEINQKHYGENHYETAYSIRNIGNALIGLNSYENGIVNLKTALFIFENIFRKNHKIIALTKMDLGIGFGKKGDTIKEKKYLEEALEIFQKIYTNTNHPHLLTCLKHLE